MTKLRRAVTRLAGVALAAGLGVFGLIAPASAQVLGSPASPNGVLAPFWTDLDGTGRPGIYIGTLTDGSDTWIVVEWDVNVSGTTSTASGRDRFLAGRLVADMIHWVWRYTPCPRSIV